MRKEYPHRSSARNKFQQNPVLDPDAIAKSLQETLLSNNSNIEAGKQILRLAAEVDCGTGRVLRSRLLFRAVLI